MFIECLNCGHKFDGGVSHDEHGWHVCCEMCGSSHDIDEPKGRYRVLIQGIGDGEYVEYNTHDDYEDLYDDMLTLIDWWEGEWIWVYDGDDIILEGVFDRPCIDEVYAYCKDESENA